MKKSLEIVLKELMEMNVLAKKIIQTGEYSQVNKEVQELAHKAASFDEFELERIGIDPQLSPRDRYFILSAKPYRRVIREDCIPYYSGEKTFELKPYPGIKKEAIETLKEEFSFKTLQKRLKGIVEEQDNYDHNIGVEDFRKLNNYHTLFWIDSDDKVPALVSRLGCPMWDDFYPKHKELVDKAVELREKVDEESKRLGLKWGIPKELVTKEGTVFYEFNKKALEVYRILRSEYGIPETILW